MTAILFFGFVGPEFDKQRTPRDKTQSQLDIDWPYTLCLSCPKSRTTILFGESDGLYYLGIIRIGLFLWALLATFSDITKARYETL